MKQPLGLDAERLRDLIQAFIRDQEFKSDLPMLNLLERVGCARVKFGKELMTYGIVQEVMRVEERKAVRRSVANEAKKPKREEVRKSDAEDFATLLAQGGMPNEELEKKEEEEKGKKDESKEGKATAKKGTTKPRAKSQKATGLAKDSRKTSQHPSL